MKWREGGRISLETLTNEPKVNWLDIVKANQIAISERKE